MFLDDCARGYGIIESRSPRVQVFRCSGNNLGVGSLEEVTVTVRISVSSKPCFMNLYPFMVAN